MKVWIAKAIAQGCLMAFSLGLLAVIGICYPVRKWIDKNAVKCHKCAGIDREAWLKLVYNLRGTHECNCCGVKFHARVY